MEFHLEKICRKIKASTCPCTRRRCLWSIIWFTKQLLPSKKAAAANAKYSGELCLLTQYMGSDVVNGKWIVWRNAEIDGNLIAGAKISRGISPSATTGNFCNDQEIEKTWDVNELSPLTKLQSQVLEDEFCWWVLRKDGLGLLLGLLPRSWEQSQVLPWSHANRAVKQPLKLLLRGKGRRFPASSCYLKMLRAALKPSRGK